MDPKGRYYATGSDRPFDVKSLVSKLEHLIDKLPGPADPERPRRQAQPHAVRRLRAEQAEGMVRDYQAGATLREIGRHYGLSRQTISTILEQAGVTIRRQGLTNEQIDQAVRLYDCGLSLARIGERLRVDASTIPVACLSVE